MRIVLSALAVVASLVVAGCTKTGGSDESSSSSSGNASGGASSGNASGAGSSAANGSSHAAASAVSQAASAASSAAVANSASAAAASSAAAVSSAAAAASSAAASSGGGQAYDCTAAAGTVPALQLTLVTDQVPRPVVAKTVPGDDHRFYVVSQEGPIYLIKDGTLLPTPFLDLTGVCVNPSGGDERGLLGLAFHPQYLTNGRFFVYYTRPSDDHQELVEYARSATDADRADATAVKTLLDLTDPQGNHNGGSLEFSPVDGFLYAGLGDGGGAGDQHGAFGNGQDLGTLWGKIIRLDVDSVTQPYGIPAGNMTTIPAGNPSTSVMQEIWDFGVRNPWRVAFDECNGDLFIADVGQNMYEEVNYEPAGMGNRNYGWRVREGLHAYNGSTTQTLTDPITEYSHASGNCSISGGYVYRSNEIPSLKGAYFYGDYCSGRLWYITHNGNTFSAPVVMGTNASIVGFGQDNAGNVYVMDLGGSVFKITAQ